MDFELRKRLQKYDREGGNSHLDRHEVSASEREQKEEEKDAEEHTEGVEERGIR